MARSVKLRELRGGERKILRAKLRDLSLAARIHQRYRVIEEVRRGRSIMEAAERAGCHFTIAYDWLHRFNRSGFVEDLHWADKNIGVRPKKWARYGHGRLWIGSLSRAALTKTLVSVCGNLVGRE